LYALMSQAPSDDSRRHPRVVIGLPAVQVTGAPLSKRDIVLIDMGPGGVFIKARHAVTGEPPVLGARVTLSFYMIGNRLCQAAGRIVRHHDHGFAVAFDDINQAMQSFTHQLAKLPPPLRTLYVADLLHPTLALEG
jgi:hypothetical protein